MQPCCAAGLFTAICLTPPAARFAFVMDGTVVATAGAETRTLKEDDFAYFPPAEAHRRVSFTHRCDLQSRLTR